MINDWSEIRINQTHATAYRKRLKSRVELLSSLGSCSPRAELKFRQTFQNVLELVDVLLHEIPSLLQFRSLIEMMLNKTTRIRNPKLNSRTP